MSRWTQPRLDPPCRAGRRVRAMLPRPFFAVVCGPSPSLPLPDTWTDWDPGPSARERSVKCWAYPSDERRCLWLVDAFLARPAGFDAKVRSRLSLSRIPVLHRGQRRGSLTTSNALRGNQEAANDRCPEGLRTSAPGKALSCSKPSGQAEWRRTWVRVVGDHLNNAWSWCVTRFALSHEAG